MTRSCSRTYISINSSKVEIVKQNIFLYPTPCAPGKIRPGFDLPFLSLSFHIATSTGNLHR